MHIKTDLTGAHFAVYAYTLQQETQSAIQLKGNNSSTAPIVTTLLQEPYYLSPNALLRHTQNDPTAPGGQW